MSGDRAAHDKLVTGGLRFVTSRANRYANSRISLFDVIGEDNLGIQ